MDFGTRPYGPKACCATLPSMENPIKHIKRAAMHQAKDYGLGRRLPRAYAQGTNTPIDPRKVLFLESTRDTLPEAFKVAYARLNAHPSYDVSFTSLGKHRVNPVEYLNRCEAFVREAATARAVFLCDGSDVISCLPMRPETSVVQLWHGCGAFKTFGMSNAESSYGLSRSEIEKHPFYENLSFVTVSSPEVVWAYVEAMNLVGREHLVQPLGVSRTDLFFDDVFRATARAAVETAVPQVIGKRIILYAPTFRGSLAHAAAPVPPNLRLMRDRLGDAFVVLVKQHPMVKQRPAVAADVSQFAFDVSDLLPIDELMTCADILVTDYSSIVFEYSLFTRPIVFFAPDIDEYQQSRRFYYSIQDMNAGPILKTDEQLVEWFENVDERFDADKSRAFRDKFMSACDGHATERIFKRAGLI